MRKLLIILAAFSIVSFTASGAISGHVPYRCGKVDSVVGSPYGTHDVVYRTTNCDKCIMVKMVDGRYVEWKYCGEDNRSWKEIPKKDQ